DDRRRQWRSRQGALVLPAHDLELEIEPELLELRAHLGGSVGNLGRGGFSDEDAMGRVRHLRLENEIVSGKKRAQRLCALSFRDVLARELELSLLFPALRLDTLGDAARGDSTVHGGERVGGPLGRASIAVHDLDALEDIRADDARQILDVELENGPRARR